MSLPSALMTQQAVAHASRRDAVLWEGSSLSSVCVVCNTTAVAASGAATDNSSCTRMHTSPSNRLHEAACYVRA